MDEKIPKPNFPGQKESAEFYGLVAARADPPTAPSIPQDNEIHNYIPVKQNPVEQNPVEQNPVEQNPVEQNPVKQNPVKQNPVKQNPVKQN